MLVVLIVFGVSGWSQNFEPNAINDLDPTNFNNSGNVEISGDIVCASVSGDPTVEVFRVAAQLDGTDINLATFEWVVFGGEIISYYGTELDNSPGFYDSFTTHYLTVVGVDGGDSWIEVTFDETLPSGVWVAVRQTSEFGCSDNNWSVIQMSGDVTPPSITGFPANVAHLAWERRNGYPFTVPTISDDCEDHLSLSMSVNGGISENLTTLMGSETYIDLIGEAPGDVNGDGTGVDNTIVFTWSDGTNETSQTWTVHVDYQPKVNLTTANNPICIGDDNGDILVDWDVENEVDVIKEFSTNGVDFIEVTGSYFPNLIEGDYYFRVSTDVNGDRSYSEILQITLTDPPLMSVVNSVVTNESCIDAGDGSISVGVEYPLGSPSDFRSFGLNWQQNGTTINPGDPFNLSGLASAIYSLRVTDSEGCHIDENYNLIVDNGVDPDFDAEAAAMTLPDPTDLLVDGYVDLNVDADKCYYEVLDNSFNPSAFDGTCGINGLTLYHDYSGTTENPWSDNETLNGARFPVGKTTVTWTATDAAGVTATRSYNIYVTDNILPEISTIGNIEFPYCEPTRSIALPAVNDNCDISTVTCDFTPDVAGWDETYNWWPHINAGETVTSLISFDITQVTNVVWTVTDNHGKGNDATYNISFTDPMVLTSDYGFEPVTCNGEVNGTLTIDFLGGKADYHVTVGAVYDETNSVTHYEITNLEPNDYDITITDADNCQLPWRIEIEEPELITITTEDIQDNTCFEATNGGIDVLVEGGNGSFEYTWSGPTYNYGDGHPWYLPTPYDFTGATDAVTDLPTGHYNLLVTDAKGCTETAGYDIIATDSDAPVYTFADAGFFARPADIDECDYTVQGTEFDPTVNDDCNWLAWHDYAAAPDPNTLAGADFPVGTHDVVWSIYDRNGNGSIEIITIDIADEQDPDIITCPGNLNIDVDPGECSAVIPTVIADFVVDDNCAFGSNNVSFLRSDYGFPDLTEPFIARPDAVTITWMVVDAAGNDNSCVQTIHVNDVEPPEVLVLDNAGNPIPVYLRSNGQYTLKVEDIDDGTNDNCGDLDALFVGTEGVDLIFDCDDIGTPIEVTLTARDASGNPNSATAWVQVFDTIAPVASTVSDAFVGLDENGEGQLLPADIYGGTFSDNCTSDIADMTFELSLTGDDGDPSDDVAVLDLTCDDIGDLLVYLVAIDESGNRGYYETYVDVRDNGAPIITVIWDEADDFYLNSKSPNANSAYTELDPAIFGTAVDACGADFDLTMEPAGVDCDDKGTGSDTTPVKLVAIDENNERSEVTINLRVRDNTAPVIVAKTEEIVLPASANTFFHPDDFFANMHDNCDVTEYYIAVETATGPDRNNGSIMASYGGRNYYNEIELHCDNISSTAVDNEYTGDVTIYLYARDETGNVSTTNFTTTVRSSLEITSLNLNLCYSGASTNWPGRFESTIINSNSPTYYWNSGRSGYYPFEPATLFGLRGSTTSNLPQPRYYRLNWGINGPEYVSLTITDGGCHARSTLTVHEGDPGSVYPSFNVSHESCVSTPDDYEASGGVSYSWTITSGDGIQLSSTNTESTYQVQWNSSGTGTVVVGITGADGCYTETIYDVTIFPLPPIFLSIDPDYGTGNYCPLNEVTYLLDRTYPAYSWEVTTANGNIVSGDDFSNSIGVEWDVPPVGGATGTVNVTVTDNNGCSISDYKDIHVEDNVNPTLTLPADISVDNVHGECYGNVVLKLKEGDNYSDDCGDVAKVEYRTRWRFDATTNWTDVVWNSWIESNSASGTYDVGETQVQWRVTDYSSNSTELINLITVTDKDKPTLSPNHLGFQFAANSDCEYTHDAVAAGVDMGLIADDNCGIKRVWVTFDGDATEHEIDFVNDPYNDPTDNYLFDQAYTTVTWHAEDLAGNEGQRSYVVELFDDTPPEFAFDISGLPADGGAYNFEGTFADGERFYIFAEDNGTTYNLDIPAVITDNCSVGDGNVTVTLTYQDGSELQAATAISPVGDLYTLNYSFPLGQTTVRWDYNDATGNHPNSVTHYIVFASQNGFGCSVVEGWVEADGKCNPEDDEFDIIPTPQLPEWFSGLRSRNILTYKVQPSYELLDPSISGCLATRQRNITLEYLLQIRGSDVDQLYAEGLCSQTFEYTVDNDGPVIAPINSIADLLLECSGGAQTVDHDNAIAAWLANNAGLDLINEVSDVCSGGPFTVDKDYSTLNGLTCGGASITPVTFTIYDACGQTTDYIANIVFDDTESPEFENPGSLPADATVNCHEIPVAPVPNVDITAIDNCSGTANVTYISSNDRNADGISGTPDDNNYTITRVWTATDNCGNSKPHTQILTVVDVDAPVWNEPAQGEVTVDCNNIPTVPVYTYTENCDINPTYSYNATERTVLDKSDRDYYNYDIVRTWSVKDNTFPPVEMVQIIHVVDDVAPTIDTEASPLVVECDGAGNVAQLNAWLASNGGAVASDDCVSPLYFNWSKNYDANNWVTGCGNSKSQEVTFTVTDPSGNPANTTATFTIQDTKAPVLAGTLVYNQGPYDRISDLPAAYTTVAEIEAAGVSVTDACSPLDAGLVVTSTQDETVGIECSYTVERVYTITDACSNGVATLQQNFIVRDGVDPVISKAHEALTICAEDENGQSAVYTFDGLTTSDISDNCKDAQWFIDHANDGAIQYRVFNTTNPARNTSWESGNPGDITLYEGISEVYYKITDENTNDVTKQLYTITVNHKPDISVISPEGTEFSGVGGYNNPLLNSTHNYEITMDNEANLSRSGSGWRIYPTGNRTTPETCSIVTTNSGKLVSAEVTFDGSLVVGNTYDLVFTEFTDEGCSNQEYMTFTLGAPFDVDIAEIDNNCPSDNNKIFALGAEVQSNGTTLTSTTVNYTISLVSSTYGGNWQFEYEITISEQDGGTDASVASVLFTDGGKNNWLSSPPTTTSGIVSVQYNSANPTTVINLQVVYNNIHGTTQEVKVALSNIEGEGHEEDYNVTLGTTADEAVGDDGNSDQNEVRHIIELLPLPGNVAGIE